MITETAQAISYASQGLSLGNTIAVDQQAAALSIEQIVTNVSNTLFNTIFFVSSAIFVYGALLYVLSAFKDENKNSGKSYMVGAIIGLAIVIGARAILNLVLMFIYG